MLRELLYVDQRRLDAYVEQIGSPVTYDKVPVWKAEVGITGPKASASQDRYGRDMTTHEKLARLESFLADSNLYEIPDRRYGVPFGLETVSAQKIVVPPRTLPKFSGATLWFAKRPRDREIGYLCLIEDSQSDDDTPREAIHLTRLSLLVSLLGAIRLEWLDTIAGVDPHKTGGSNFIEAQLSFKRDPLGMLRMMGASFLYERKIETLYRIRDDMWNEPGRDVLAYPIFIADARFA